MAANKFATFLHRNTNRLAVVLVYTLLEWILITLLFCNAFFFYFISKFIAFFGLKPPCILCSRVDHLLETGREKKPCHDLICSDHVAEISQMGRGKVEGHRKVAGGRGMCEDCCLKAKQGLPLGGDHHGVVPLMELGNGQVERMGLRCLCCGEELDLGITDGDLVGSIPFWCGFESQQRGVDGIRIEEVSSLVDGRVRIEREAFVDKDLEDGIRAAAAALAAAAAAAVEEEEEEEEQEEEEDENEEEEEKNEETEEDRDDRDQRGTAVTGDTDHLYRTGSCKRVRGGDAFSKILYQCQDCSSVVQEVVHRVGSVDSRTEGNWSSHGSEVKDGKVGLNGEHMFMDMESAGKFDQTSDASCKPEITSPGEQGVMEEIWEENQGSEKECKTNQAEFEATVRDQKREELGHPQGQETISQDQSSDVYKNGDETQDHETKGEAVDEVLLGSKSHEQEKIAHHEHQKPISRVQDLDGRRENGDATQASEEDCRTDGEAIEVSIGSEICELEQIDNSENHEASPQSGFEQFQSPDNETEDEIQVTERKHLEIAIHKVNNHLSVLPEDGALKEEGTPEYGGDGFVNMNRKFMLDRRESGNESADGSVTSDADSVETLTVDHLKSAFKAERKALNALYAELEEERSAAAIAAHQTMAMITRLQEEKAAMQMEALHYQRMMEQQSLFDQQALHNEEELAKKQEMENQILLKKLEVYRRQIHLYKAKERMRMRMENAIQDESVPSSINESDNLSFDFDDDLDDLEEETDTLAYDSGSWKEEGASKSLSILNEFLAEFEEERISILEQKKVLEDKLLTVDKKAEPENAINHDLDSMNQSQKDEPNDELESNYTNQFHRTNIELKRKNLLPLFDAVSGENENDLAGITHDSASVPASEKERLVITGEMDTMYQRLHALEEDRTFLEHCISSLKKGDKEMDLMYAMLQYIRTLRSAEMWVRNASCPPQ